MPATTVCIVIESIIKDDILAYMINSNLLANLQYGFVPGKSFQSNFLLIMIFLTTLSKMKLLQTLLRFRERIRFSDPD